MRDEARSRRFYETYFGFDTVPPERMSDGVLMLFDGAGFSLALKETDDQITVPGFLHFAFRSAADVDEVQVPPGSASAETGVPIVEEWEEPGGVEVGAGDPDGFVVEFAWEPDDEG